jgi:acyl-homoserine-lactone acylase
VRLRPVRPTRRALAAVAATALVAPLLVAATQASPAAGLAARTDEPLTRATSSYRATITRTSHGIPHVVADGWGSLGFGHGYATAQTNLCNLADTLVTGRGERSKWFGPDRRYDDQVTLNATNLQADALFTDIHNRKVVEKLLADPRRGPGKQARAMVRGYVAGVNKYLRDIGGRDNVPDPTCRGRGYLRPDVTPLDLWYGVYAANLLASTGVFVPQIVDAAPPTQAANPTAALASFADAPAAPSREALLKALGKDPRAPFGSNATAVGSAATSTGRGMVLGNPHFPWRGRYRFEQVQLTIPGVYDVAGASLIGSPVVNIGWNRDVAWSHTVSTAYRFTPYEYKIIGNPTTYLTDQGPKELQRRTVTITVRRADGSLGKRTEDLYRTPQGYVLHDPATLQLWTPVSFFALRDANAEHLRTVDTFLQMGKARTVRDLLRKQDTAGGMPWVNTTAADRNGDVVYADHSVVPHVSNDKVDRCATPTGRVLFTLAGLPGLDGTRATSDCNWGTDADASRPGIFGPKNLPAAFRKDWVANANDSYWLPNPKQRLEGFARIIGCEECERTLRTRMVYRYVLDRLARDKVTPRALRGFQHQNRIMGAVLARRDDDLVDVCEAADGGASCDVLKKWDGRSNRDSVGTHIFQEFMLRALEANTPIWEVPFDASDPVGTPRDLNENNPEVVQAMSDALAFLADEGIAPATPWGRLQVAGDEGAPAIGLGGGDGFVGNANVLSSRTPAANKDRLVPVSYGSSHIQAVSFLDAGRVLARTILTYSQSTDPTSRWSADQTRLFAQQKWVSFPFTRAEIRADRVSRRTVSAPRP